jgi:hypothetical protein
MRARFWWAAIAALLVVGLVVLPTVAIGPAGSGPDLAASGKAHPTRKPKPTPTATPVATPTTSPSATASPGPSPTSSPSSVALVGAGDIASCASSGDEATALLLDGIAGTVFTVGDNAYESGTSTEFSDCYGPTWGRQKARTRPAIGNHEYGTPGATGYFGYFGSAAGNPAEGYYAYDIGTWRAYVLNSNCTIVSCAAGSTQEQWLRADLAANPRGCVVAFWHHPRFSSGPHGSDATVQPFWQALYDANADLVVVGHDHDYERFAPQTPTGVLDPARGVVEFVVGTGGRSHYAFATTQPNRLAGNETTWGVLRLDLSAGGYAFSFVHVAGATFTDSGSGTCH